MAIIWMKKVDNTRYEVRSHGASMRLYTDGVFHSQYNENSLFTGSLWDILALPALLSPPNTIKTVLVLGVGGGSVIQTLLKLINPTSITGIELNPTHLYIAKRYFKLTDKRIQLVEADAIEWIKHYKGPKFDLILEDLYGENEGEPQRVMKPNKAWLDILTKNLSAHGLLAMNFVSKEELKQAAFFDDETIKNKFATAFQLSTPLYQNRIAVFTKEEVSSALIKTNLNNLTLPSKHTNKLSYTCRKLS